jgi:hypothetical protein
MYNYWDNGLKAKLTASANLVNAVGSLLVVHSPVSSLMNSTNLLRANTTALA